MVQSIYEISHFLAESAQEESLADDISEHKSEAEPSIADDQSSQ